MLLCADGHDCGFLFVPSYLLYGHFGDIQYNCLLPKQTFETFQYQNDPAYSVFCLMCIV